MRILGVWDGHDAGAALLVDGQVAAAANEERYTRRKLEICFPAHSIDACLKIADLPADAIDVVATSTTDPAKTLARWFPSTKEMYYKVRRRQARPGAAATFTRHLKYCITELPPNVLTVSLSRKAVRRVMGAVGLGRSRLGLYDHHQCHAATAAFGSRTASCLVVTLDGVGDGLSATVSAFRDGRLQRIAATPASASLGVFFEHVTNLLNMRELEDEGKVMALGDYATAVPDDRNPLLSLVVVDALRFRTTVPGHALRGRLKDLLWYHPTEQFAYMAQRTLELRTAELVANAIAATGLGHLALAGGVASNIKMNRALRMLEGVDDVYVFPHMGDGGLALGAAICAAVDARDPVDLQLDDLGLGAAYSAADIECALRESGVAFTHMHDRPAHTADLLARGCIVLWFDGRMEYGPRALGHRSILARPDSSPIRDRLNLLLKRRVWYQPFCPTILESDGHRMLSDWNGCPNRHMTMEYMVAPEWRTRLAGTISIKGSCRPQLIADSDPSPFGALLRAVRERVGVGAVLNTSFNIHGEPLVENVAQAIDVFRRVRADALVVGDFLVPGCDEGGD